jgi:hypothetical protein
MPTYRAFFLKDKHITEPPALIEADSDDEAIRKAQTNTHEEVDIWLADRHVALIKPPHPKHR